MKTKINNFVAKHMHINKGGKHVESFKALRNKNKIQIKKELMQ
jgi:hypothetical protein